MIDKRVSVLRLLNIQDRHRFNLAKLSALLVKALAKFRGKRNVINVISQFSFLVSLAIVWHKQMSMNSTPKYAVHRHRSLPLPLSPSFLATTHFPCNNLS